MTDAEKSLKSDFRFEISESLDDINMIAAPRDSIENSQRSIALFIETKNSNLIAEVMRPRSEHGALLPLTFAYRLFQDNPYAIKVFYKEYPFFEKDIRHLASYCVENSVRKDTDSILKRFALLLHCSTNLHSFSQITPEIWKKIIAAIRTSEPNSTWHPKMNFKEHHAYAIRTFSKFLDSTYPAAESYESITRIKRRPSKGSKSKANNQLLSHPPAHLKPWVTAFIEYRNYLGNKTNTSQNNSFRLFTNFLNQYPKELVSEPKAFLSDRRNSPSLISHFTSLDDGDLNQSSIVAIRFIHRFTEKFIEDNMMFTDEEQTTTLGISLLSPSEIEFLNIEGQRKSPQKNATSTSSRIPKAHLSLIRQILSEDDWKWPKSLDVHSFIREENGVSQKIWNPVIPYLIYAMTEMPWRKIQFLALDSGEGDTEIFNPKLDRWETNTSENAGYWNKQPSVRKKARGVLNKVDGQFNFYVNTNKTSDAKNGFDESSGYYIPFKHSPLIELFDKLRHWQEKYNPVSKPTHVSECKNEVGMGSAAESVLRAYPERFYLFRDIQGPSNKVSPPTENRIYSFWRLLMDELQRRLLEQGEDTSIVLTTNSQGKCQTSIYNIHGLRVTGLTAFAESNVPINILSKIVAGHASVLMTFYYLKHSTAHVSEILSEAHQKIHTISSDEFRKSLKEASIDNLKRKVVANEDYTLDEISSSSLQPDQFFDVGVGLCPKGGAACAEGTRRAGGRYSPVKGGPRNCVQCRFLISGEPWLIPLTLKQQHLIAKTQTLTARHKELDQKSEEAKIARFEAKKAGDTAEQTRCRQALKALENEIEAAEAHLHDRFADITAVHSLIKSIRELPSSGGGENLPALIAHENFADHGYGEGTRFQQLDTVLQASTIYPFLQDRELEMEREAVISKIMMHNELTPLFMLDLSDEEKRNAANASSKWLLTKLDAADVDRLASGKLTLRNIGEDAKELSKAVEAGISNARAALSGRSGAALLGRLHD